ncbi:MAG: hypothetical protein ACXW2Q_14140 [Thermoanaerobaculia bacterium]
MSGIRLVIGIIVMGVVVPVTLFFLLNLQRPMQMFTIAATTFLAWGAAELLAAILQKPRLKNRSPQQALREDLERRSSEK